ncbi:hypothetical protein ACFCV3_38785 [Kribbella sp. NPDC056345]|uniref:hypothetical protein n=1 Tax=Kribbella sp. NPDC056345 TaxID=3345789 RepID=UPI0035DF8348
MGQLVKARSVTALAGAVLITGAALTAVPAHAAGGTVGVRETVCAQDLELRVKPGGARMGTLHKPQTFLVKQISGEWAFGFAYGDINHDGWVQDGWFC